MICLDEILKNFHTTKKDSSLHHTPVETYNDYRNTWPEELKLQKNVEINHIHVSLIAPKNISVKRALDLLFVPSLTLQEASCSGEWQHDLTTNQPTIALNYFTSTGLPLSPVAIFVFNLKPLVIFIIL